MELEITSAKKFFESLSITLSDYWLESCIQWYRDENPNTNYTLDTLHLKVYQQWMLLDLRDVEISILPRNLPRQTKYVLNGTFPLQIMHIIDISRPKLWQLQRIRNRNIYNHTTADQEAPNSKRCLLLLITDGVTEIEAIEYAPIKSLNINLPPGTKIKLTGPVMIRKGQLFLEEKNVQVLGGEVEELLICNAPENILARALNLPENPNPSTIIEETDLSQTTTQQVNVTLPNAVRPNATNSRVQSTITNYCQQKQVPIAEPMSSNAIEDEEMRIMSEIDMLMEAERDMMQETKIETKPKGEVINLIEDDLDAEKSIFEDMDIDAHLDMLDEQLMTKNQTIVIPRASLGDLRNKTFVKNEKFLIKAKFKRVIQKLCVSDNCWVLKLLLEDDVNELEVFVHTDVLTKLIGYSPSAMMALKKDILNKNQVATATVMKAIEDLKAKIMNLDGLMEITYFSQSDSPSITELK